MTPDHTGWDARSADLAELGRRCAASLGHAADLPIDWAAYGAACRAVIPAPVQPGMVPASAPPWAAAAPPAEADPGSRHPLGRYLGRVAFGIVWRVAVVLAVVGAAASGYGPPWFVLAAFIALGVVLGLWHRGWGVARLWRILLLGAGVGYLAPGLPFYSEALVGSLGIAAIAPWFASLRRPARVVTREEPQPGHTAGRRASARAWP